MNKKTTGCNESKNDDVYSIENKKTINWVGVK